MIATQCINAECSQVYRVKSALMGQTARCRKCHTVFLIKEFSVPPDQTASGRDVWCQTAPRKKPLAENVKQGDIEAIQSAVVDFLPRLNAALRNQADQNDTLHLVQRMLQDILGHRPEDIMTAPERAGRRPHLVVTVDNEAALVLEFRKIGRALKDNTFCPATACAAYPGARWVLFTNAMVWQLFHVPTRNQGAKQLVFTIDLKDGLDDREALHFYAISKSGLSRDGFLETAWRQISMLCYDNIVATILSDAVITRIRTTLGETTGCPLDDDDIRQTIEEHIFQLS